MIKLFFTVILFIHQLITALILPSSQAGGLNQAKVTISDSRSGHVGTSHVYDFNTSTLGTIATITIQYCTTAIGDCSTPTGLVTTGASLGAVSGIGAVTTDVATNGIMNVLVTTPASVASGTTIDLPFANITNPTTNNTSYFVRVNTKDGTGDTIDSVVVAFATLTPTSIAVTATVGSTLQVSINPVTSGTVNGQQINMTDTTSDAIPFGTLYSGSSKVAAHDITVATNAGHGYSVSVKSGDPPLTDGGNSISKFTGINSSPTLWSAPSGVTSNVNTGFFGYTTEDFSLCSGQANRFDLDRWAGMESTPYEIICSSGAVNNGRTVRVGWRAEVNNQQPSGNYSGIIILVITPTY